MYEIIADLHAHSISSEHAFGTIREMALEASAKGLYALAVTDHYGNIPGAPTNLHFCNMAESLPLLYNGVLLLCGAEANVIDLDGNIDLPVRTAELMDWVVVSIHDILMEEKNPTEEQCTRLWLNVAENPYVNVIGHCGSPRFAFDYERLIPVFGKNGKLVEINAHSFVCRKSHIANCREIAKLCKKHSVSIVVNSDSHSDVQVGEFYEALEMLEELDFPPELIVNSSKQRLDEYFKRYTKVFDRSDRMKVRKTRELQ